MRLAPLLLIATLAGCSSPVKQTATPMTVYDKNTRYAVDDRPDGFTVSVEYSRYQFIPESDAVALACRQQATAIAWEVARSRGVEIKPINDQEVRVSMGRNGGSGVTSCTAAAPAYFAN